MKDNLVNYIDKLSEFEKHFVIMMVRTYSTYQEVHLGTLPFLNRKTACKCLNDSMAVSASSDKEIKKAKQILSKLGVGHTKTDTFQLALDTKKVFKYSTGNGPTGRLMRLPTKKVVEAGIQWNAFRRKYTQFEVAVHHQIVVSRRPDGFWTVECDAKLVEYVRSYLEATYGNSSALLDEQMRGLYQKAKRKHQKTKHERS